MKNSWAIGSLVIICVFFVPVRPVRAAAPAAAQALFSSGLVQGTVIDPTGAVVPNATVTISNPITGFQKTDTTNANGQFTIRPVPFNHYHVLVTAPGFSSGTADIDVRSTVPVNVPITVNIASAQTTIRSKADRKTWLRPLR